ncbi:hypothetical protein D3C87_627030 [compost metagenome]
MQIDRLEPGNELDWLVLHHVFDWKRGITAFGEAPYRCRGQEFSELRPVSTELAAAWSVVDHALRFGLSVDVQGHPDERAQVWRVRFTDKSGVQAEGRGETVPLTICRAALHAVKAALLVKSSR